MKSSILTAISCIADSVANPVIPNDSVTQRINNNDISINRIRRKTDASQWFNSSTCAMLQPEKDDIKIYLINMDISKPRLIRMSQKVC